MAKQYFTFRFILVYLLICRFILIFFFLSLSHMFHTNVIECLSCDIGYQPKPQCAAGYTLRQEVSKSLYPYGLCEKKVYSNVEWRCLRGNPMNESMCKVVEKSMAHAFCDDGLVLFGHNCYGVQSKKVSVTTATRFFKKILKHQEIVIPYTKDRQQNETYFPLREANYSCQNKLAILDKDLHTCSSIYFWDRIPICAGSFVLLFGNVTLESKILMCMSLVYSNPRLYCVSTRKNLTIGDVEN